MMACMSDVTRILAAIDKGDAQATAELLPLVYDELRRLAQAHMSQQARRPYAPTDGPGSRGLSSAGRRREQAWEIRGHFFAAAAEAMRRILIENARRKRR